MKLSPTLKRIGAAVLAAAILTALGACVKRRGKSEGAEVLIPDSLETEERK